MNTEELVEIVRKLLDDWADSGATSAMAHNVTNVEVVGNYINVTIDGKKYEIAIKEVQ
jgi:hypothetical protein